MSFGYKCGTCGVIAEKREHVCRPLEVERQVESCSFEAEDFDKICDSMAENLNFQCNTCGRPSEKPDMLCSPKPIR